MNPCSICWHSFDLLDNYSPSWGVHVCVKLHIMHTFCVDTDAGGQCLSFSVSPKHLPAHSSRHCGSINNSWLLQRKKVQLVHLFRLQQALAEARVKPVASWISYIISFFHMSLARNLFCVTTVFIILGVNPTFWRYESSKSLLHENNKPETGTLNYILTIFSGWIYIFSINFFFYFWIFNFFIGELQSLPNKQ